MEPAIKRAIASIPGGAWQAIEYTDAVYEKTWIFPRRSPRCGSREFGSQGIVRCVRLTRLRQESAGVR